MKLVFPSGEHGQVLLSPGANRVGSAAENAVVLTNPGIQPLHCVVHVTANGANLQIPPGGGAVSVNGKPVTDLMSLRPGDTLTIGPVTAKYAIVEAARPSSPAEAGNADEDSGATRVR